MARNKPDDSPEENTNLPETVSAESTELETSYQRTRQLIQYLHDRANQTDRKERAFTVMASQAEKILAASEDDSVSLEDLWEIDEGGTVSGKDFVGPSFRIYGWEPHPSSDKFDAPLKYFAGIECSLLTTDPAKRFRIGEQFILNTGAPLVIVKLRALEARGLLPIDARLIAIGASSGDVLKLRPALRFTAEPVL